MADTANTAGKKSTRVALVSLGCKLNQAETELLAGQLASAGCRLVAPSSKADIYIVNTCTVTHIADRKSRNRLRQAHHLNPDALVVATGCYAQRASQEIKQIEGVGLALGNDAKMKLVSLLRDSGHIKSDGRRGYSSRNRAFIKVQDGCNSSCAYCIVPLVRGREKSLPDEDIIAQVKARTARGCREVVLTGTEIGAYRHNGLGLEELLGRILNETDALRLRLSSLQPEAITTRFIKLWLNPRMCRHFHLSLQSGSDSTLGRMKRSYRTADYSRAVSLIRQVAPEAAVTTDVIVGFPGETDEEFEESLDFCRRMEFARIHVFPFSPRPGTEATRMPAQIGAIVKKQRSNRMLSLAEASACNFIRRFLGRTMPVLWEQKTEGIWSGLTDNYIRVYTRNNEELANRLLPVKLVRVYKDGVWGEVAD
ncbi:MAG: tRNA (N(6)-L-threonylcarbamoyladenosine(37)-C(2))-methylthiotransferase MtaB [Dehalococcoidales bacterium]|nr:tRNA (N(6)-L-threonylcarbamoyladenosine(37)-C(2))-methylthiotransferase MtaB [Dehalococcoidales bacterium]